MNREINGKFKMADLLSNYTDKLLKSVTGDESIDNDLEQMVQLFMYLADKDLFADSYRSLLARRLLNQKPGSDDLERSVISKLKLRCGAQFTAKMEGMISDLLIGNDINEEFKGKLQDSNISVDFSIQILTTGYWPSFKVFDELTLPPTMAVCNKAFETFYETKTNHRRLKWLYSLGNANVKMNTKNSYMLQLTTLQAIVIMRFSNVPTSSPVHFETLVDDLKMPKDVLKSILHSLSCGSVVILKKVDALKDDKTIQETDRFIVNWEFQNVKKTFRVPMTHVEDTQGNRKLEEKRLEEDRTIVIEASIVRIMKSRKQLHHQQLVGEVLHQLTFFKPDTAAIKRRIEALIDREYLERDASDPTIYKYLA
jgi:cullin 1